MRCRNSSHLKKIIVSLIFIFGVGHADLIQAEVSERSSNAPSAKVQNDKPTVTKIIANVEYRIPVGYLSYPMVGHGYPEKETTTELIITAFPPDMREMSPKEIYEASHEVEKGKQEARVLILEAQSTSSFQDRLNVQQKIYGPFHPRGMKYGLLAYLGSTEGMGIRDHDPSIPKERFFKEFYTDNNPQGSTVYITCDGDIPTSNPLWCEENFSVNGLLYKITFNKEKLPQWQDMKSSTLSLMRQFSKQAVTR